MLKRNRLFLLIVLALCLLLPLTALAEGTEVKFSSKKLEGFAREALGIGAKDPIYQEELAKITKMTLCGEGMITGYRGGMWNASGKDSLENVKLDDLKYFPNLTSLRLELGEYKQTVSLDVLTELTNLTGLFIQADKLKNLDVLASLTKLTDLGVSASGVKTIAPLAELSELKQLYLNCSDLEDISVVENLDKMTHLSIFNAPNVTSIAPVCGMEHIVQLELDNVGVRSLEPLRTMTRKFSLRAKNLLVKDWSPAYGFGSSDLVNMEPEPVTFVSERFEQQLRKAIGREDSDPVYNTELANITSLTISSGKVEIGYNYYWANSVRTSDKYGKAMVLDDLINFPQLTELMLDIPYNTSESLEPLRQLGNLETLCLRGNKLTSLEALGSLHYLETLEIMGKGITDISFLEEMQVLDTFGMYHTAVESIEPLGGLKYIGMGEVRIGDCRKIKDYSPIDHVGNKKIN